MKKHRPNCHHTPEKLAKNPPGVQCKCFCTCPEEEISNPTPSEASYGAEIIERDKITNLVSKIAKTPEDHQFLTEYLHSFATSLTERVRRETLNEAIEAMPEELNDPCTLYPGMIFDGADIKKTALGNWNAYRVTALKRLEDKIAELMNNDQRGDI